ncbi:MAG TPA: G1 family glutamic endopeptidase, partial [Pseudonocardiaceae bacterium]
APEVYYKNTVSPGDVISASVTRKGTSYTLALTDKTKKWTKTTTKSYHGLNLSAEVVVESTEPGGGPYFPNFGTLNFTGATVNGKPLASFNPTAYDASFLGVYEDHTSPLSGGAFSVTYEHE